MKQITNALLFAGLALCLLQVWWPAYYVTGDGPCHVYNAQVLHDLWSHSKATAMYRHFFTPVYQPNPNWLSTLVLALLLNVVKGAIAEKIFLTVYMLAFIGGFYALLKKISGNGSAWMLVILLFVFPHTLAKGFYNFSFSIAFYFWMVWSWLRFLERKNIGRGMLFFLFTGLLFFTHLLAFGFGVFTCAALLISYSIAMPKGTIQQKLTGFFLRNALWLAVFVTPFLLLMQRFTNEQGGLQLQFRHHFYRLVELAQFKYIVNVTHREDYFALAAGVSLLVMFCIAVINRIRTKGINKYDGFLLSLLFALFVYLFFPEEFLGRLILISMRAQLFVFILIVCCIAYLLPDGKIMNSGSVVLFTCFIGMTIVRISCMLPVSEAEADYLSAGSFIKPYSVVLPLCFAPEGKDVAGNKIADRNYLFVHAADYMGTEKPLIMLDNFEAYMGYFPLRWTDKTNPYHHLGKYEGIEGNPPYAGINEYKDVSGVTINYILLWCFDSSALQNTHFRLLYDQINSGYHIIYTSPAGRTILYEHN
jgi:hypothetical protein